jgi:hypothetical protein
MLSSVSDGSGSMSERNDSSDDAKVTLTMKNMAKATARVKAKVKVKATKRTDIHTTRKKHWDT